MMSEELMKFEKKIANERYTTIALILIGLCCLLPLLCSHGALAFLLPVLFCSLLLFLPFLLCLDKCLACFC